MKDKKDKLKIYKKTSNPICNGVTGIKFNLLPKSAKRVEKIIKKKKKDFLKSGKLTMQDYVSWEKGNKQTKKWPLWLPQLNSWKKLSGHSVIGQNTKEYRSLVDLRIQK